MSWLWATKGVMENPCRPQRLIREQFLQDVSGLLPDSASIPRPPLGPDEGVVVAVVVQNVPERPGLSGKHVGTRVGPLRDGRPVFQQPVVLVLRNHGRDVRVHPVLFPQ